MDKNKSQKRVLFLVNHDVVIYNFRLEIVKALISEGYQVYISSPYGERIDELVELGCIYIKTEVNRHGKNVFQELALMKHYRKILKNIRPDVILTYTIKPNIYGGFVASMLKIPYIANITGLGTAVEEKSLMQKLTVLLYKIAFRRIDTIYFQNKVNQLFFENQNIYPDTHKMLPGSGVNLDHFKLQEYPQEESIQFIFISRIMKSKGIEEYLAAAKHIRNKYPQSVFHILGFCEEDYQARLRQLHNEGIVNYHGMQRDIRPFLEKVHCTVHPSFYPEGLSNVLLESAACGRPLITTDRPGCREVVEEGYNGYLVETRNTATLIEAIERFIDLPYEEKVKLGENSRKKVESEYDRTIVVNSYLA
ncbi:glycosyltransferase family 4 protein, partial [Salinicoccus sp. ID82-1]|nr:glycosyltransferase family 4 protein [Salinicoccus sp. ID82-1]